MDTSKVDYPDWLIKENQHRKGKYVKDLNDEEFLREFNESLATLEDSFEIPNKEPYPIIYFFGLPRIGKTMFSQLLCHSLNTGFPNNFVARFWKAPTVGIKLSRILGLDEIETTFESDIGKTKYIGEPHDFAYFWHHWFRIDEIPYDYKEVRDAIDWNAFAGQMKKMSAEWDRPAVFKGVLPSYHINQISRAYSKSFFIYIKRDYIDSAISFCRAKEKIFGDKSAWFGQPPSPEVYNKLCDADYADKIAGHFKSLVDLYDKSISSLDPKYYTILHYKEVCENPNWAVDHIINSVQSAYNFKIDKRFDPPNQFQPSIHTNEDNEDYQKLAEALKKVGLPLRF